MLACVLAGRSSASPAQPPPESTGAAAPAPIEEVEVAGERPGPSLWKVSRGEHVVWLLGTLDPLPRRMTWRSREVEAVIEQAQEVLPPVPSVSARIGPISAVRLYLQWRRTEKIPDGESLQQWLSPALYARLEALRSRYDPHDSRINSMRPMFAARRLYERAIEESGLTSRDDIQDAVLALAHKHHVLVHKLPLLVEDPRGVLNDVDEIPRAVEIECLEATIERIETDMGSMQQRARAWALGDVERLRELPYPKQRQVCYGAVSSAPRIKALVDRAGRDWNAALEAALVSNRTTLAMKPIYDLIAPDGLLAALRARGYRVEGP